MKDTIATTSSPNSQISKPIRVIGIGAGNRMRTYAHYLSSIPQDAQMVAVADPDPLRCETISQTLHISKENLFNSYQELFDSNIDADLAIICTPDDEHFRPALTAIRKGMHVLLEKPIAQSIEECRILLEEANLHGVKVGICHPMHYHPAFLKLKEIVANNQYGDLVSATILNQVGTDRATHSYVRGIFNNEDTATPIILAKCSHDIDYLLWLASSKCEKVCSMGKLMYFNKQNAPKESGTRCIDCKIEKECPYSAVNLYWRRREWIKNFNVNDGETIEDAIQRELKEGRYGLCVHRCNNNVADHQSVIMQTASGATLNLTIDCFTLHDNREIYLRLTKADIYCNEKQIIIRNFLTRQEEVIDISQYSKIPYHAGSDLLLVEEFIKAINGKQHQFTTFIEDTIESHQVCWQAEESRKSTLTV